MASEKKSFINVDELMGQIGLEQAVAFYGVSLPELKKAGAETRTRCFLTCGKTQETGDRALAIQADTAMKTWHCHQYGCGKSGNLVGLCDLLKPGENMGARPRGQRFKEIATDMKAMVEGVVGTPHVPTSPPTRAAPTPETKVNVPLARSPNERARPLVNLDAKFVVDVAAMPPAASKYFRMRSYLTPQILQAHRVGYLPRDGGEDKSGGIVRGRIVYPFLSETGELLTWFGRDPEFEVKHKAWEANKSEPEPEKFRFVKGFHRGIELWNQHALRTEGVGERLRGLGLILVEGPNDAIRLDTLGVPAVALCSCTITREQAAKAAHLARDVAGGVVTVLLDCDAEGHNGMRQCLGYLAQLTPVRLAWSEKMYAGKYRGRQPESLTIQEWQEIEGFLKSGNPQGWTLA